MHRITRIALFTLAAAMLSGCEATTLAVNCPTEGAEFRLRGVTERGIVNRDAIDIPDNFFRFENTISAGLVLSKDGYRSRQDGIMVNKWQANVIDAAPLEPLDTSVTIRSTLDGEDVPGAWVRLNWRDALLPDGWTQTFRTPVTLLATRSEAEAMQGRVTVERVHLDGAIPDGSPGVQLDIAVGGAAEQTIAFTPREASVHVTDLRNVPNSLETQLTRFGADMVPVPVVRGCAGAAVRLYLFGLGSGRLAAEPREMYITADTASIGHFDALSPGRYMLQLLVDDAVVDGVEFSYRVD